MKKEMIQFLIKIFSIVLLIDERLKEIESDFTGRKNIFFLLLF